MKHLTSWIICATISVWGTTAFAQSTPQHKETRSTSDTIKTTGPTRRPPLAVRRDSTKETRATDDTNRTAAPHRRDTIRTDTTKRVPPKYR